MFKDDLALREAIDSLPIPRLWVLLGLRGQVSDSCTVRSPLRDDDRSASFSIFAGGRRWKDHGTGASGDSYDLYQIVTKQNARSARVPFITLSRR